VAQLTQNVKEHKNWEEGIQDPEGSLLKEET
jgi:hypothetical protein